MREIPFSQFRENCSMLLEQVRGTKEPIRILRHGKPLAEIVPPSVIQERSAWIGSMKDSMQILGDIVSPVNEDWD